MLTKTLAYSFTNVLVNDSFQIRKPIRSTIILEVILCQSRLLFILFCCVFNNAVSKIKIANAWICSVKATTLYKSLKVSQCHIF